MLRIDPSDSIPIWKQIEEGVLNLIATGALRPEDPVSSVRELARELKVNPLTVSKAYRRLADMGVLTVRRGEGTFVSLHPPSMADDERLAKLLEAAARFATQAHNLSATESEGVAAFRRAWKRLQPTERSRTDGPGSTCPESANPESASPESAGPESASPESASPENEGG